MFRDTQLVCNQLLMSLSFWNLSRHSFPCRDKHFPFSPINSIMIEFSLSQQDLFESLEISVTTGNSLVATDFSFLIPLACRVVCCDIELFVVTQLPWLFSVLLQFLSQPNFFSVMTEFYHSILLSRHKTYLSRHRFFFQLMIMSQQKFLCCHCSCVALQLLVATGNSPPSCFSCRDRNNLCRDRDFVVLGCEF